MKHTIVFGLVMLLATAACAAGDDTATPPVVRSDGPSGSVATSPATTDEATPAVSEASTQPAVQATPTTMAAMVSIRGTPPLYDGGEGRLGPPILAIPISPEMLVQVGSRGWGLGEGVPYDSAEPVDAASIEPVEQPQWFALCLTYEAGGRFCQAALLDPGVRSVFLEEEGATQVTCADGRVVAVANQPRLPTAICS